MDTYITPFDVARSPHGLEIGTLTGNLLRLSSTQPAGVSTLPVTPNTTVQLNPYDPIVLFDGSSSEEVTVSATVAPGQASIPLQSPTQFAHNGGTPICSDGPLGSLAVQIVNASAWVEEICNQSLFQVTWTNEELFIPSMEAWVDNQSALGFKPHNFPVSAITAMSLKAQQSNPQTYDPTQAIIDSNHRLVKVPTLVSVGSSPILYPGQPLSRRANMWLTITYTSGFTASTMPTIIKDSCILLLSDILSRRQNPTGADQINLGGKTLISVIRGDTSGDSMWVKQAITKLSRYTRKAY